MKKGKIIGIVLCVIIIFISAFAYIASNESADIAPAIVSVVVIIFLIIPRKQKQLKPQKGKFVLEEELQKANFIINKDLKIGFQKFLIDDVNKKFALTSGKSIKIFNFSDMLDFELNEDGSSIAKGKGLSTAVGAATFGLVGAMVGASGKRKNQSTCTSMVVRIMMNNLENPQIVIPFVSSEIKKNSFMYKSNLEIAKNLVATLTYIDNQNTIIQH